MIYYSDLKIILYISTSTIVILDSITAFLIAVQNMICCGKFLMIATTNVKEKWTGLLRSTLPIIIYVSEIILDYLSFQIG